MTDLVTKFVSLGNNCEFGLVQKLYGFDPLDLFRWAGINVVGQLLSALQAKFADFGTEETVELQMWPTWPHAAVIDRKYGVYFHSEFSASEIAANAVECRREAARKLRFLCAKLVADLETGEKTFVYRQKEPLGSSRIRELHDALSKFGPVSLLVVNEDHTCAPGTVERLGARLFLGYSARLSNENPPQIDVEVWKTLCERTHSMRQGD